MKVRTSLPFLLERLKSYDADYAGKGLVTIVYLVNREHQDFPKPDETMKHWKITSVEDCVAEGMKDYWEYYGLSSTPTLFLLDRNGNVVDTTGTTGDFDQVLATLMGEEISDK
jgi:hypothetical protein